MAWAEVTPTLGNGIFFKVRGSGKGKDHLSSKFSLGSKRRADSIVQKASGGQRKTASLSVRVDKD